MKIMGVGRRCHVPIHAPTPPIWEVSAAGQVADFFSDLARPVHHPVTEMGATGHDEPAARERGVAHPRGSAGATRVERPRPAPAPPPGARGSHCLRFTREGHAQARPLFERAVELDPNYAEAYALLGVSYGVEYGSGGTSIRTCRASRSR